MRSLLARSILLFALALPVTAAEPSPYTDLLRDYYTAVSQRAYARALVLRSSSNHEPAVLPLPGEDCAFALDRMAVALESERPSSVELKVALPVICGERATRPPEDAVLERAVKLVPEDGKWRIAREESVFRRMAELLLRAPAEDREAMVKRLKVAERARVGAELIAAADRWFPEGEIDRAESAVHLIGAFAFAFDPRTLAGYEVVRAKLERYRGNVARAAEIAAAAIAPLSASGDAEYLTLAHNELAIIRLRESRLGDAETEMKTALQISESLDDPVAVSKDLIGLGIIATRQARYREAASYYERAEAIRRSIGDDAGLARVLDNYGILLQRQDELAGALSRLREAANLYERLGNRPRLAGTLLNVARVYRSQGNHRLALEMARRSHDVFCETGNEFNVSMGLREIAGNHIALGEWRQAIPLLHQSLALAETRGIRENTPAALMDLGDALTQAREFDAALRVLREALEGSPRDLVSSILVRTAAVHSARGDHRAAIAAAAEAIAAARTLGKPGDLLRAATIAGDAQRNAGNTAMAAAAYGEAIAALETMRAGTGGAEVLRAEFLERRIAAYHGMMLLLVEQRQPADALAFAERAKARVLLDVLDEPRRKGSASLTPAELARRRTLTEANLQLAQARRNGAGERRIAELRTRVEDARLLHQEAQALAPRDPSGANGSPEPMTVGETTALLEYVITREEVLLFVVTAPWNVEAFRLGRRSEIEPMIARYRDALAEKNLAFQDLAGKLHRALIAPAAAAIGARRNLVIVPDGAIWSVAFDALRDSDGKYLVETTAITYAPSAASHDQMSRARRVRSGGIPRLLAMGNPVLELADAEAEVRQIAALYGRSSVVHIRGAASEERFKKEAPGFDVLHLATHGVAEPDAPMYSHVELAANGAAEDGLLEAWEIAELAVSAELVVLSACDTAAGRQLGGEGVIGLAWAWFLAGSPTAVLGRWPVDSAATTRLMVAFHGERRAGGISEAEALRRASIALMRDPRYAHPYYWAAFQVIGGG